MSTSTVIRRTDPVIAVFGSDELPATYDEVLHKILRDNFVTLKSQDLMVREFATRAISEMRESEVDALKKRITLALRPPAPIPSLAERHAAELVTRAKAPKPSGFIPASWAVMSRANNFGDKNYYLLGKCQKCGQSVIVTDVPAYFEHCGAVETVPTEAVNRLRAAQGRPVPAALPSDSNDYARIMLAGQRA